MHASIVLLLTESWALYILQRDNCQGVGNFLEDATLQLSGLSVGLHSDWIQV